MPRGDKSSYGEKQRRKAEYIEKGCDKEAERRSWATLNKGSGGGNNSGSGCGKKERRVSSRKGRREGGFNQRHDSGRRPRRRAGKRAANKATARMPVLQITNARGPGPAASHAMLAIAAHYAGSPATMYGERTPDCQAAIPKLQVRRA